MEFDSLEALQAVLSLHRVSTLVLAECGNVLGNNRERIESWNPRLALLSVEAGNAEGLPHPETLEALQGVPSLCTDRNSWIELSTDGERLWVEVEKKKVL